MTTLDPPCSCEPVRASEGTVLGWRPLGTCLRHPAKPKADLGPLPSAAIVCDLCRSTDGGPFVTCTEPERLAGRVLCKACLDALGIKVNWGPSFVFKVKP